MPILGASASGAKSIPVAPTIGTATNVGTSRAYNNGSATVTFTAPTSKLPITSYTVTSSPGSYTGTGASSPITVAGLQSATAYTFTVTATSAAGTSAASSASNSITATTVPQAPTIGTATSSGATTASVPFTAGATGGSAITSYTVTSSPSSITGTGASSPVTVSGLTTGTAYTFTVTATNANGTSTASSASNSVTPAYSISSWTASTAYPESVQVVKATSITSRGAMFKNVTNAASYLWNGTSWSANLPTASVSGQGTRITRTSATEAQTGSGRDNTANVRYYNGTSWSTTTNSPLGSTDGSGYASLGSNSIRIGGGWINFSATYVSTSYYRTGTGAWTQGTSMPVAREYTGSDTGTFSKMVFTAIGASNQYTATTLDGAWTSIGTAPYPFMDYFTLNNTNACAYYFNGSNYVYALLNDNGSYTVIGNAATDGSWGNSGTWGAAAVGTTVSQAAGGSGAGAGTLHYRANAG